mgnify:CR=1 FL=1
MNQVKIYAAVFRDNMNHQDERVEYFCRKDITPAYGEGEDATPELYATDFLLEEGEWLDTVLEEEPITDPVEVIGVLEGALNYIREVREEHGFVQDDIEQKLEKLLVSYVATST